MQLLNRWWLPKQAEVTNTHSGSDAQRERGTSSEEFKQHALNT